MAVTPNYSWPVPVNTDLVKDGAEAIKDLGDAVDGSLAYMPQNNQVGTTYTFTLADVTKLVTASNAAASTYTIPPQASVVWVNNTIIKVTNLGAGVVTFAAGAGVTVTNTAQTLAQYATANLMRTASNAWTVVPASGGGASGLTLINTTTFSAQTSVSFNNVFSATYQNYMIMVAATFTSDIVTTMRLRVGGVDTVGTDYENQFLKSVVVTVSAARFTGDNKFNYGSASAGDTAFASITLTNPFAAARTSFIASAVRQGPELDLRVGQHTPLTSFDGISFLASSGTFTGTIRIYGVQN